MVNFPLSFDNDNTLFLVGNNLRTELTSNIDASTLTIPVVTTSGFPSNGYITILTSTDITDAEAIRYTSTGANQFNATQRGAGGTVASAHIAGDNVDLTIVADHHNQLKDAIVNLEYFVGVSGAENFLPIDDFGNATVSGNLTVGANTVLTKDTQIGWLAVSGTATVSGNTDLQGDVSVSGVAYFGDAAPASSLAEILFASQDTEQTTTSTVLTSASCETGVLVNGVDYLVLYSANHGNSGSGVNTEVEVLFGSTRVALSSQRSSLLIGGVPIAAHYGGGQLNGINVITGNGSSTLSFRFRTVTGGNTAYIGAMSIVAIPLSDRFTINSDYFFDATANSDSNAVSNAPTTFTSILSSNFSLDAGNYLVFMSVEGDADAGTVRAGLVRFQIEGATIGPTYAIPGGSVSAGSEGNAMAHLHTFATGGTKNFTISVGSTAVALADFRRARICVVKASLFSQIAQSSDTTGVTTSLGTFQDFSGLNTSITPSDVLSPVLTIVTTNSYTTSTSSAVTLALRNETEGITYRDDAGGQVAELGGTSSDNQNNAFMFHYEKLSASTEYRAQLRSTGGGVVAAGRNDANTGGDLSEMLVWEYRLAAETVAPIDRTIIADEEITTGTITADYGYFRQGLTISGAPVSTGTLTVREADGSPSISSVHTIVLTTGTLTDLGDGVVEITISGVSGGGVTSHAALTGLSADDHPQYGHLSQDEIVTGNWDFSNGLTVSGLPVLIGPGGGGLNNVVEDTSPELGGNLNAQNFDITNVDALTAVTGTFTAGITVGGGTTYIFPDEIRTGNLIVSGTATVLTGTDFPTSLTVSGVPVSTGTLTIRETDGSPLVTHVHTIVVTTGTLTDLGSGTVQIDTGGGGGGGVTSHGALTGLDADDHPQYGHLSQNETVTGNWDFSNGATVSGLPIQVDGLTIQETDGSPTVAGVKTLIVSSGTLTDNGNGTATIAFENAGEQTTVSGFPIVIERFRQVRIDRVRYSSSTTATNILSATIPANTLAPGRFLQTHLRGEWVNDSGASRTYTLGIRFGGNTIYSATSQGYANSAVHRLWLLDMDMLSCGNSEIRMSGMQTISSHLSPPSSGIGNIGSSNFATEHIKTIAASGLADTSLPQLLEVELTYAVNLSTVYFEHLMSYVEVV